LFATRGSLKTYECEKETDKCKSEERKWGGEREVSIHYRSGHGQYQKCPRCERGALTVYYQRAVSVVSIPFGILTGKGENWGEPKQNDKGTGVTRSRGNVLWEKPGEDTLKGKGGLRR